MRCQPQSNVISVVVKRMCANSATSSIYMFFFGRLSSSRLFSLAIMAMTYIFSSFFGQSRREIIYSYLAP